MRPATTRSARDSLPKGIKNDILIKTLDEAFFEQDREKPMNSLAVVVVYDGKIIAERYAPGFYYNSRLMGWSMTKSITNALIGILVKEGKLTSHYEYLKEYATGN